jgi:hypothetical protein
MVNPEDIYAAWHKYTNYYRLGGKYPRKIKNFDKAKDNVNWPFFEKFANFANKNGLIDYNIFIKSLAEVHNGYFHPKILNSQKAISIYRNYIKKKDTTIDAKEVRTGVKESIIEILKFCKQHELKSFNEYFMHNSALLPSLLRHYRCGNITGYFLVCIPQFKNILKNYDDSFVEAILEDFFELYRYRKEFIIRDNKLKHIYNNFYDIMDTKIGQLWEGNK